MSASSTGVLRMKIAPGIVRFHARDSPLIYQAPCRPYRSSIYRYQTVVSEIQVMVSFLTSPISVVPLGLSGKKRFLRVCKKKLPCFLKIQKLSPAPRLQKSSSGNSILIRQLISPFRKILWKDTQWDYTDKDYKYATIPSNMLLLLLFGHRATPLFLLSKARPVVHKPVMNKHNIYKPNAGIIGNCCGCDISCVPRKWCAVR